MFRITAIGAGAVDYFLRGCDDPGHEHEITDRADSADLGADQYFARAIACGEPAGVWLGKGWEALGLDVAPGDQAAEDDCARSSGSDVDVDGPRRCATADADPVGSASVDRDDPSDVPHPGRDAATTCVWCTNLAAGIDAGTVPPRRTW